jgi:hypothetical protein
VKSADSSVDDVPTAVRNESVALDLCRNHSHEDIHRAQTTGSRCVRSSACRPPFQDRHHAGSLLETQKSAAVLRQSEPGSLDLPLTRLTAQLRNQFVDLYCSRSGYWVTFGQKAAGYIDG